MTMITGFSGRRYYNVVTGKNGVTAIAFAASLFASWRNSEEAAHRSPFPTVAQPG
ncbi:hypothetical protein [Escherichia coli]|uniref:hypothetical protein n=1 Tax=Escherichia coli TaxID=562 RepID=UPI00388D616C